MKLGIKALACGVLALAHLGLAAAGPIEDAEVAFNRGDYVTAMKILRPLAERGDATAEYDVGVMYDQGFGVTQNQTEAANGSVERPITDWRMLSIISGLSI